MGLLALAMVIVWVAFVGGVRAYLHFRRTGQVGFRPRDAPGSPQRWSRTISTLGFALLLATALADLAGVRPIESFDHPAWRTLGIGLYAFGLVLTWVAQAAMGASWRGDVDPAERTALVTTGPFRFVRNPILTATALTATGLALLVPNLLALPMLGAIVLAMQIQVRLVEEPYLRRVHGESYRRYSAQTGRFVPWIGRDAARDPDGASARRA